MSRLQRLKQSLFDRRGHRGAHDDDNPTQLDERATDQAEREAAERADREAAERAQREAAEREATEQAERDAADRAALEQAERDAADRAATEQEAQAAAERAAAEQAQREAAEREAAEQQERDAAERAEREAAEQAQRQAAERETAEQEARAAAEQAERDAADQARRQAAEREAAAKAQREAAERQAAEREATDRSAAVQDATPTPQPSAPAAPLPERPAAPLPNEAEFKAWDGGWRGGRIVLDNLAVTANQRLVAAALVEAINAEGPIHLDRLARLVALSFEVRKLSPSRITDIAGVVPKSTVTTEQGSIFWPARVDPLQWASFRGSTDVEVRPTEHIALRELANAMLALVSTQGGMSQSELFGITRRIFGGKRVTANVEARMLAALDEAVRQGRIERNGDTVTAASSSPPEP